MRKNNYTDLELNLIISEKYENKYYVPVDLNIAETISFIPKTICTLTIKYNAELCIKIKNKYYIMLEIERRETIMEKEDIYSTNERNKYISPLNHSWRKSYKN